MASIYYSLRTEKQYKASTGLKISDFNRLFLVFEKYYFPKKASPIKNTLPPLLTDKKEALFFILHYLKAYPTLENMGIYFEMDVRTVCDYIKRTKTALKAALIELDDYSYNIFDSQADFDKAFEGIEDIVIDCTEIPVQRPKDYDSQAYIYSGKKNSTQ
jgi:hypothetical protein